MTKSYQGKIIGMGSYLPKKILTNSDLEKMVDTSDEWIQTRTGMKERRIAAADEFTSDMGAKAARKALKNAKVEVDEIDLILFATFTPDYFCPSTACLIQAELGAANAAAMDLSAACSGYIYGMSMAKAYVETGMYRTVLVIAADKLSSIVDYTDRDTCILFGDAATACVVSADQDKPGYFIDSTTLGADGSQAHLLMLPGGGSRHPATKETVEKKLHYVKMEGKEVFKHAVRRMEAAAKHCIAKAGLTEDDVSYLVPHQANIRIIEAMARRFKLPMEKVFKTVHKYGNTSASAVGVAFNELNGEVDIQKGEHILLVTFGGGFTWAAAMLTRS